jgi:APA family basic amino acid/polyamine antiporter
VLGIVKSIGLQHALEQGLSYYVGLLAATILFIATNAGLIGISRLSWSLAEHRQLPAAFSKLHPRYRTPAFTIVFYSVLACILIVPGKTDFLGNLYSFGAMLSFTTAHVAVITLRVKEPDRPRPYRAPLNFRLRGRDLSLTPILGALGTFVAWLSVVALHVEARTVGIGWMVAGLAGYAIYRRRSGLDLTTATKIERGARPPDFTELSYRSALVPIFGTDVDADALAAAARLVDGEATVDALYVLPVPPQLPLDAGLEAEEARGRSVLESARLAGRARGLRVRTALVRTRNPARAILDEARRKGVEVIYLSTAHAPASERPLGPITAQLLAERPVRVVIQTGGPVPTEGPQQRVAVPA